MGKRLTVGDHLGRARYHVGRARNRKGVTTEEVKVLEAVDWAISRAGAVVYPADEGRERAAYEARRRTRAKTAARLAK